MPGLVATLLFCSVTAPPNPWPFDFDPAVSLDPDAVERRLQMLGEGLPGLPADQLTELTTGPVRLFFFTEMAAALTRAEHAGPQMAAPWTRDPELCPRHGSFSLPPSLLADSSTPCEVAGDLIESALAGCANDCLYAEFAETYVRDHEPAYVDPITVSSFEGLIALVGEALTHVEFHENLFPADTPTVMRSIVAKLRYPVLTQNITDRLRAYTDVINVLQTTPFCFDSAAAASVTADLTAMTIELHATQVFLDDLHTQGVTQAAADRDAARALGRIRAVLPYPALTDEERETLAFYIGGIYWRMRGAGLVPAPSGMEALYYAEAPYRAIAELSGGADGEGVGTAILVQENWGWGDYFDIGSNPVGNDKYRDLVDMTDRGKLQVEVVEPLLAGRGYDTRPLVAGGLQMGPCYYYAFRELADFRLGADLESPYMHFLEGQTAIGEFCLGATLALGLVRTLLAGKPDPNCVPACTGRVCGPDGCGASCGACAAGTECSDGTCECAPDCDGRACGENGCGGSCGGCTTGEHCEAGHCACTPDCAQRQCGDDGCGGTCGACDHEQSCTGGQCVCAADCLARECGNDGCDGSCGTCARDEICIDGLCRAGCPPALDAADGCTGGGTSPWAATVVLAAWLRTRGRRR